MSPVHLSAVANHLWQSTLFAGLVGLLTLALRQNTAQLRYRLWLAASLKFLVPFALLVSLGGQFAWHTAPTAAPRLSAAIEQISQPFASPSTPFAMPAPAASVSMPPLNWFLALWMMGAAAVLSHWCLSWRRVRAILATASPLPIDAPIAVMTCRSLLEPGVFGIFRPILLLPEGIADRLTPAQLQAILAHEFCHVRRRDNLAAALHMVVEAVFWFHPLVWWIGSRLIEERERACDEQVLREGSEPEVYAAGILHVCRYYVKSPVACASGVTGADLKRRIEAIMTHRVLAGMTFGRRLLLAGAAVVAVALPILVGSVHAAQSAVPTQPAAEAGLNFEVASIRPADPNSRGMMLNRTAGNGIRAGGVTLKGLLEFAYDVADFQISGGPAWLRTERYDISAKPERPEGPADIYQATAAQQKLLWDHLRERTRALLSERFQLLVRRESAERSVYLLVVAKGGHKLHESPDHEGITRNLGVLTGNGATLEMLAPVLSRIMLRPVLDRTNVNGAYKFKLQWAEEAGAALSKDGEVTATSPESSGLSIFSAIQEQMGLKLESAKGPVEMVVIERAEKPSVN